MTTITLTHLVKTFPREELASPAPVVDDLSLRIGEGEVLAIVGPSGCGKTTLLRLIAGLEIADSGTVAYDGVPLADIPPLERGIGMVFQNGALMPHWETGRSVGFFLKLRKREHEVPARVARIAEITGFGLHDLLKRRPDQLSGGERQRVAIARALTRDPRVFLFDEPFSSLDAKLRGAARLELRRLLNEFPVTSVYVTHDQIEAVAVADRVAVMRDGRIVQIGTYQALYDNPVDRFVATFVGVPTINCFEGVAEGGVWSSALIGDLPIRADLEPRTRVTLGIRPEYIHLSEGGFGGRIESVIPYFAERYRLIEADSGSIRWHFRVPLEVKPAIGDWVRCTLDPAGVLFFDDTTGARIG